MVSASDDRYLVCRFDVHECPSIRLWRGVWMLMIKDYQPNNIYLIKVRVQTLEHKHLLNIVSSQNTNDYCRTNDTRQRNIRSRKNTLERKQLMKCKIYLMKNMAFDHLVERWSKGMVVGRGSTKMTNWSSSRTKLQHFANFKLRDWSKWLPNPT